MSTSRMLIRWVLMLLFGAGVLIFLYLSYLVDQGYFIDVPAPF